MVKTQIQIPDRLFEEAKRVASDYEMSFAEVVRRGLERIVTSYPERGKGVAPWSLPRLDGVLEAPLKELKKIAAEDRSAGFVD